MNQVIELRKNVWRISLPAIAESLFGVLASIIDTKMVSALGVTAISAIAVTSQPRFFILCIFFALNVTVSAIVARLFGKRDQKKACEAFITSLVAAVFLCLLLSAPCVLFADQIMNICSGQEDTLAQSVEYFSIVMGFLFLNVFFMLVNAVLRGCGYTKVTMTSNIAFTLVNILGNWLLISGHWGFPALGVKGAAISTVFSSFVACFISFYMLARGTFFVNLGACLATKARASMAMLREMLGMWRDVTGEKVLSRIGLLLSSMVCARIGAFDMAVYSVAMILMNVSFAFGDGFMSSTLALVGRSMGEGAKEKVLLYCKYIQRSGFLCSLALGLLYVLGGRMFFGFFNAESDFVFKGLVSSVFIGVIGPIQVSQLIYNGLLKSAGKTKVTLVTSVVGVTIVNPALSFVLALVLGMGLWGVWISVLISQIVRFAMLRYYSKKAMDQISAG